MQNAPIPIPDSPAAALDAGERAVVVGRHLAVASEGFMNSLRVPIRTSADLSKAAGVNKDIASRFMAALSKRDPLAVIYYMPGVESLRRLSRGARSREGDLAAVQAFDEAIVEYEEFLKDELGGRHALDAMASAWLPEARERFEAASRQMAFRAAANLRGVECQTIIDTAVIHPGSDPDRYDAVSIQAIIGVRRLRPKVTLTIATYDQRGDTAGRPAMTIDGRPITGSEAPDELLLQYCKGDPLALRVVRSGTSKGFQLVGEALGAGAANDVYFGQYSLGLFRKWAIRPDDVAAQMEAMEVPSQRLVMDIIMHRDVWPGLEPDLMLYNTCGRGPALPYDRSRDGDRIDMLDTSRLIGHGIDCCRVSESPQYVELLQWLCEQRRWNPADFRVYRCDAKYPVVGVQYVMGFHLKPKP